MQREFPVCMGSKAVSLSAWPSLNLEDVETEIKQQKLMEEKQVIKMKLYHSSYKSPRQNEISYHIPSYTFVVDILKLIQPDALSRLWHQIDISWDVRRQNLSLYSEEIKKSICWEINQVMITDVTEVMRTVISPAESLIRCKLTWIITCQAKTPHSLFIFSRDTEFEFCFAWFTVPGALVMYLQGEKVWFVFEATWF